MSKDIRTDHKKLKNKQITSRNEGIDHVGNIIPSDALLDDAGIVLIDDAGNILLQD